MRLSLAPLFDRYRSLSIVVLLTITSAPALMAADAPGALSKLRERIANLEKQQLKIGVIAEVDVVEFLDEWSDRKVELRTAEERLNADLDGILEEIKRLRNSLPVMDEGPEKDKQKVKLADLERKYRAKHKTGREDLIRKRDRYAAGIHDKMSDVVGEYARDNNFSVIIKKSLLFYNGPDAVVDITEDITQIMNEKYAVDKNKRLGPETAEEEKEETDEGILKALEPE